MMRTTLLLCGLVLIVLSAVVYTAKAQGEAPELSFPESGAPAQAQIDFYETEIKKCKDYVDELSLAINKAQILLAYDREQNPGSLFAGYGWSSELRLLERQTQIVCHRITLYRTAYRGEDR